MVEELQDEMEAMEDDGEEEEETFSIELSAVEMYSLQSILNHASIEMPNPDHASVADQLSKLVQKEIASDEFNDEFDEQMREAVERAKQSQTRNRPQTTGLGRGVQ